MIPGIFFWGGLVEDVSKTIAAGTRLDSTSMLQLPTIQRCGIDQHLAPLDPSRLWGLEDGLVGPYILARVDPSEPFLLSLMHDRTEPLDPRRQS